MRRLYTHSELVDRRVEQSAFFSRELSRSGLADRRTPLTDERKYYLSNVPSGTPLKQLAAASKARWVCEQAHQQLKEELGLDHFEGRPWTGSTGTC